MRMDDCFSIRSGASARATNRDRGYPMTVESKLEVEIAFDSVGKVVGSRYAEDGREGPVPEAKTKGVWERGVKMAKRYRVGD